MEAEAKRKEKEEREREKRKREEEKEKSLKKRKKVHQELMRKNRRGQPIIKNRIHHLLDKIKSCT